MPSSVDGDGRTRARRRRPPRALPFEAFGWDEIVRSAHARPRMRSSSSRRASARSSTCEQADRPREFPIAVADVLRERGVELRSTARSSAGAGGSRPRHRARRDPSRAGRHRCGGRGRGRMLRASRAVRRRAAPRRRAADLGAAPPRAEDVLAEHDACGEELTIISTAPRRRTGTTAGSGPIQAGEPSSSTSSRATAYSGCYADTTRTFCVGEPPGARRVPPALPRGAERSRRGGAPGRLRTGAPPHRLRRLRGRPAADAADEDAGRAAPRRLLPFARARRRARGARGAVARPDGRGARRGRRRRDRAWLLPPGLRRLPDRGSRPRHGGRRRGADAAPVRARARSAGLSLGCPVRIASPTSDRERG